MIYKQILKFHHKDLHDSVNVENIDNVSQVGWLDEGLYQPVLLPNDQATSHSHPGLSQQQGGNRTGVLTGRHGAQKVERFGWLPEGC